MKYNRIASIALVGGVLLLAASCVKEVPSNEDQYRPAGTPIAFSAATSYQNSPESRAEYSGDIDHGSLSSTTPLHERIYWENGDKIRIVHIGATTQADNYIVSSGTNVQGERESIATLRSGNLVWDGSGNHTFYGLYPCDNTNASKGSLTNAGLVSGSIPPTQNVDPSKTLSVTEGGVLYSKYQPDTDQFGYMAAYATITANSTATAVRLPFRPAFTTFEFKLQRAASTPDQAISYFELKTVAVNGTTTPLTGKFSLQINGGDTNGALWNTPAVNDIQDPGTSIIVGGFTGGEVHVPTTGYLDFSVLALPINLKGVELVIHYANNATKTLKFMNSGSWHEFTAAKKYVITNTAVPGSFNWVYKIEQINDITTYGHLAVSSDVGIVSYRYIEENGSPVPGSYEAVPWKAQYNDGTTWNDWTAPQGDFSFGSSYTGNGVSDITTNEPRTVSLVDNTHSSSTGHHTSTWILQHRAGVTDYSLCDHDLYGNSISSSTANTYVVSTWGSYTFPCVYGNGIENGSVNTAAYSNSSFHDAINSGITSPWVYTDLTTGHGWVVDQSTACAVVVWQDEEIITTQPTARFVGGNYWIDFSINQSDIKPGNAVIALRATIRNGAGTITLTDAILWSWQIWVTERDLTPIDYMLPVNLGWNVDGDVQTIQYTNRELPIRIQQIAPADDPSGAIDHADFTFTQLADAAQTYELAIGSNPYYQWGRKDPMIPGLYYPVPNERGDYCIDKPFYHPNYPSMSSLTEDPGSQSYAEYGPGIRKPYVGLQNSWTTGWIGGDHSVIGDVVAAPYNLWDNYITSANSSGSNDSGVHKIKTVYDPCPYGFTVPCYSRFDNYLFTNSTATDGGRNFSSGLFMPYSGARIFYNRIAWGEYSAENPGPAIPAALYLRHVNQIGLYWTDTPYQDVRYSTILLFSEGSLTRTKYTRGTAAAIRPMVDPKHPLTPPASYPPAD